MRTNIYKLLKFSFVVVFAINAINGCKGYVAENASPKYNSSDSDVWSSSMGIISKGEKDKIIYNNYRDKKDYYLDKDVAVSKMNEFIATKKVQPSTFSDAKMFEAFSKYAQTCFNDLLASMESEQPKIAADFCKYKELDTSYQGLLVSDLLSIFSALIYDNKDADDAFQGTRKNPLTGRSISPPEKADLQDKMAWYVLIGKVK